MDNVVSIRPEGRGKSRVIQHGTTKLLTGASENTDPERASTAQLVERTDSSTTQVRILPTHRFSVFNRDLNVKVVALDGPKGGKSDLHDPS